MESFSHGDFSTFLKLVDRLHLQLDVTELKIMELCMQGRRTQEVAVMLGLYDRKVRRVYERVWQSLTQKLKDE